MTTTNHFGPIIVAANTPQILTRSTRGRGGILLYNPNTAAIPGRVDAIIHYSVGAALDPDTCLTLLPNEKVLLDFISPDDVIWVQSPTAGVKTVVLDFKR